MTKRTTIHLPAEMTTMFDMPRSEARRLIATGWVKVNGEYTKEHDVDVDAHRPVSIAIDPVARLGEP